MSAGIRPAWVDNKLFPFDSHFAELDGHVLHYIDEGPDPNHEPDQTAPTLLMLHGNPTWSFLWRDAIRSLRGQFRCVALDYPGFGLSSAKPGYRYLPEEHVEVVTAFVEALGITGATLVGQDWGGPIGLAVQQRRPNTFSRLVLANTWAWPTNRDPYFASVSQIGGSLPLRLLARRVDLVVNAFIPSGHRRRKPTSEEMDHYRRAQDTPNRRQASAILPRRITASHKFFTEIEAALPQIGHLPTLITWGGADWVFRTKDRERLQKCFPNHQTVVIEDAGLYVESDAPEEFAEAIRNWHIVGN